MAASFFVQMKAVFSLFGPIGIKTVAAGPLGQFFLLIVTNGSGEELEVRVWLLGAHFALRYQRKCNRPANEAFLSLLRSRPPNPAWAAAQRVIAVFNM
jgi:hypothetical protein